MMGTRRQIRKVAITIAGGATLLIGMAMIILPGPAILVIPVGLAILATEYAWAARWLEKTKNSVRRIKDKVFRRSSQV